jgi:hypothetical protein
MGISLNNTTPAVTYPALIKFGDNFGLTATLKNLSDGDGNDLPIQVKNNQVNIVGTLTQNGVPVTTPPSGVAGAIQFSNGSAFASDATNLFWDDTNNRLGVGTNDPQTAGHFRTSGSTRGVLSVVNANDTSNYGSRVQLYNKQSGDPVVDGANGFALIYTDSTKSSFVYNYSDGPMIFGTAATERMRLNNNGGLTIKGNGSTSATPSLLVQNSAGGLLMSVTDDGVVNLNNGAISGLSTLTSTSTMRFDSASTIGVIRMQGNQIGMGNNSIGDASALLTLSSTTKGFLPPRMTTTQRDAISSPASGLVLYNSTTNKLQCYNGSTWNDLF